MVFNFKSLEEILVCPKSKSPLVQDGSSLVCTDPGCRLRYDIRDDIPVMLVDEAAELGVEQWSAMMRKHGRDPHSGVAAS
jgi:uncharacterized protein YbaR (Trm112 family)